MEAVADVDVHCAANAGSKVHLFENVANFTESNGDGARDDLDFAPSDATAFAAAGEAWNVRFQIWVALRWNSTGPRAGTGTVYDVMRGFLAELPVGSGTSETRRADGAPGTALVDGGDPVQGAGFYHLVRGSNACGVCSYGAQTSGAERTSLACP